MCGQGFRYISSQGWKALQGLNTSVRCSSHFHPVSRGQRRASWRVCLYVDSQVESFAEEDLLDGAWIEDCALLVVPGGADLPYCRQLNGAGNCLIRCEHPASSASHFFFFCSISMLCSSFR